MLANRPRAAEIMEREKLEALVATTPENVFYLTDLAIRLTNWNSQTYAVLTRESSVQTALIVPTIRLAVIAQQGIPAVDLYVYGDFFVEGSPKGKPSTLDVNLFYDLLGLSKVVYADPLEALRAALKDRGLEGAPIGIDEMRFAPLLYTRLQDSFGRERLHFAHKHFREIRLIKTPEEIDRLRHAAEVNEQAERELIEMVAPGVHEAELAQCFRLSLARAGATPQDVTIGGGPRSAFPTVQQYTYQIQKGDLVHYDLGCQLNGYHADTGRTVVVGTPSEAQERYFGAVLRGWERIVETIRPGVRVCDVFETGVAAIEKAGIRPYRRQHVGHAIGLETYDDLLLGPNDRRQLREGMVLCIETPYYELGFGGFQVEDTIVVMEDGVEFLTCLDRVLFAR